MNFKIFINFQRFVELELFILLLLLLGVTTYVIIPSYTGFFLASTKQSDSLFCYGDGSCEARTHKQAFC